MEFTQPITETKILTERTEPTHMTPLRRSGALIVGCYIALTALSGLTGCGGSETVGQGAYREPTLREQDEFYRDQQMIRQRTAPPIPKYLR